MIGLRIMNPVGKGLGRVNLWKGFCCPTTSGLYSGARGMAALKNWKRPSMDELPAPTIPYVQAERKRQQRYNLILFAGVAFLGFTISFAKVSGIIRFYGTPDFAKKTGYVSKYESGDGGRKEEEELVEDVSFTESEAAETSPVKEETEKPAEATILEAIPEHVTYLLVGAGTAAFSAYRAIKASDAKAKILIIGDETRLPYMRPPLSKELWYGSTSETNPIEDVPNLKFRQWNGRDRGLYYEPETFYTPIGDLAGRENGGISILRGCRVARIDADKQTAYLNDGRSISYDKCLIATGGTPKSLPVFDQLRDKVTLFRRLDDYFSLAEVARKVESIVVVGGGFLGSELACALAAWSQQPKLEVIQIFPEHGNMAKVLPEYLSTWTTDKVRAEGVRVFANSKIKTASIDPETNKLILTTSDNQVISADHAIVAVGIEPEVSLAKESNLEIDNKLGGFKVNEELEARPNLWVAGDAASFNDVLLGRRRVEHHDNAVVSGKLAGENMTGSHKQFTHQSMFWSDLGPEIGYEAIGLVDSSLPTVGVFAKATPADTPRSAIPESGETLRKSETETSVVQKSFTKPADDEKAEDYGKGVIFYLKDNIVVGVLLWNVFNKISVARKVIRDHRHYDDLSEVAKLFNIHQKLDDEQPPSDDK